MKTSPSQRRLPSLSLHYAWIVAAVTFVTLLLTAAIRATPSVLIVPFENEFRWTPASIFTVISINLVLYGLIGPFAAGLIQRFGPNKIMVASLGALGYATRSPAFWLLAGSFFVCGASTNGLVGTHLIPACVDHGFSEADRANLLAAMGVCDLIGTTLSGWLSDRFSNRWLLIFYYGLRGLSLLLLPWSSRHPFRADNDVATAVCDRALLFASAWRSYRVEPGA